MHFYVLQNTVHGFCGVITHTPVGWFYGLGLCLWRWNTRCFIKTLRIM